ncbi:MAG: protein translocase subunit SecD [Oscillospiraceae bacterium]|jgi:SecD/SecF fusion protein|nr:protein translocase subunit SecD [Oscillospiraceae bacterium]
MRKSALTIGGLLLIIAILVFTSFFGLDILGFKLPSLERGVKFGLDLVGGSEITYEAEIPDGTDAVTISNGIDTAITMLRQRLNSLGYTEANVYKYGEKRIVLEVPNVSDPEQAVQMLGTTAVVQFRDWQGNVILDGKDIQSADAVYGDLEGGTKGYIVQMKLTAEGTNKFREGTKSAAAQAGSGNNFVAIYLDEEEISRPSVEAKYATTGIDTDSPVITLGSNDAAYAKYLAEIIKAGQLPFALRESRLQAVGAQLGEKSLDYAMLAGVIGIILVMIYMVIIYRLPGLIADFSLILYIALFLTVMSKIGINLTLPGIAGIVLTAGMAVDANVIIYERLREELAAGRTLRAAIDAGFNRAFTAILDSNITTLIAASVLLWQGTGTILGFAKTLFAGVVLSMLVMLLVPRLLLRTLAEMGIRKTSLYSSPYKPYESGENAKFSFTSKFKFFGTISIVISAVAIIGLLLLPFGKIVFNLDHDFVGGVTMDFELNREITPEVADNVGKIVTEIAGFAPATVTKSGNGGTIVSIKMNEIPTETREIVFNTVNEAYGGNASIVSSDFVSASVGRDITRSAFLATSLAAFLILIYIAFRFELRSGIAAIIALLHDVMVMLTCYVLFQIPMNMNFIAAMLTVIGYSINATIIIFDRIRENNKRLAGTATFAVLVDRSVFQTLRRSVGTTLTTLLPLLLIIILGVDSVRNFGIPIAIGITTGCYSSIFISGPLWNALRKKDAKKLKA